MVAAASGDHDNQRDWMLQQLQTQSVWTVDLVLLFDQLIRSSGSISQQEASFLFSSNTLQVNETLGDIGYYRAAFLEDQQRVRAAGKSGTTAYCIATPPSLRLRPQSESQIAICFTVFWPMTIPEIVNTMTRYGKKYVQHIVQQQPTITAWHGVTTRTLGTIFLLQGLVIRRVAAGWFVSTLAICRANPGSGTSYLSPGSIRTSVEGGD
jgi:hypothetical protein